MPIRFRCAYCNQLLGIARRKAGQVVRCPTCAGQVVVPSPDEVGEEEDVEAGAPSVPSPPVFERSDFDEVFHAPAPAPPAPPLPITEGPGHGSAAYDVEPFDPGPRPPPAAPPLPRPPPPAFNPPQGIVLSPAKATVLTVVWIVSVAVAFGIGLLVGLSLK
jgi:phage FluMu protein Com